MNALALQLRRKCLQPGLLLQQTPEAVLLLLSGGLLLLRRPSDAERPMERPDPLLLQLLQDHQRPGVAMLRPAGIYMIEVQLICSHGAA